MIISIIADSMIRNMIFSTHVKFYHVPGVKLIEFLPNIEKHIILKKNSPKKYYDEIIKIVDNADMISQMSIRVEAN